jgi:hypothetical protein
MHLLQLTNRSPGLALCSSVFSLLTINVFTVHELLALVGIHAPCAIQVLLSEVVATATLQMALVQCYLQPHNVNLPKVIRSHVQSGNLVLQLLISLHFVLHIGLDGVRWSDTDPASDHVQVRASMSLSLMITIVYCSSVFV